MQLDRNALVAYYRNSSSVQREQQARLATITGAWRRRGALWASLVDLSCRLRMPALEPACVLGPTA